MVNILIPYLIQKLTHNKSRLVSNISKYFSNAERISRSRKSGQATLKTQAPLLIRYRFQQNSKLSHITQCFIHNMLTDCVQVYDVKKFGNTNFINSLEVGKGQIIFLCCQNMRKLLVQHFPDKIVSILNSERK